MTSFLSSLFESFPPIVRSGACLLLLAFVSSGCGLTGSPSGLDATLRSPYRSIRDFGVLPTNSPSVNRDRLQAAIDWASPRGAALFVDPSEDPYPVDGGLRLRQNVSILGVHGPTGRGTVHPEKRQPVGSVFAIRDQENPFITVEGATQLRGLQFWYPEQTTHDPEAVIEYPATIQVARDQTAQGVTLACLTFYGEFFAMDFVASPQAACEQILVEHCYGYPLSGKFVHISFCYDIPRILHCHVNPANNRYFAHGFSKAIIDSVIARRTFAYALDFTDNAQCIDLFTFGTYGGIYLGPETYGQMTNFNFDCVTVGILKIGNNTFNRNWMIAQGSIIANVGETVEEISPIIIDGVGHTSITNVEAFSGGNPVVTFQHSSYDFLSVRGDRPLTVSLFGCRMRNYAADDPITILNPKATVRAIACIDKNERPYDLEVVPDL